MKGVAPEQGGKAYKVGISSRGFRTIYISFGMSREAISDMLVIIIGKMGKVPEYWQRASILYTFKKK